MMISMPKITPAMGALNVAAMAAETPALRYMGKFSLGV